MYELTLEQRLFLAVRRARDLNALAIRTRASQFFKQSETLHICAAKFAQDRKARMHEARTLRAWINQSHKG